MRRSLLLLLLAPALARADAPQIPQHPAVSDRHIAFVHAGDL